MLVRKYFVVDTDTGEHMHRDLIAENRIKRSYAYKRMQESLERETKSQDDDEKGDDFYTDMGLPPLPRMNSTHFDDAGREWKYTINGWEVIENEYDPVVKMTPKLEVVVAKISKQPWLDLSNRHIAKDWKTGFGLIDNFEDNLNGYNAWGDSKAGHNLENPLGANSTTYGSFDNEGFVIRGGAQVIGTVTNLSLLATLIRSLRYGRGIVKHTTTLADHYEGMGTEGIFRDSLQGGNYIPAMTPFKRDSLLNSFNDNSHLSPNLTQSFMDSIGQDNINKQPDSIYLYSRHLGFEDKETINLGTGSPTKKDSVRFDSFAVEKFYMIITKLKTKK